MSHARVLNRQAMMWLPAALLTTAALLAAAGLGGVANSNAASTGTTTVSATVGAEVHVNLNDAGSCGPVDGSTSTKTITGAALSTTQGDISLATCRMTFGSNNNAAGANLLVESTRTSGTNSFCVASVTLACGTTTFTDVGTAGVTPLSFGGGESTTAGNFGISAVANAGCTGGIAGGTNIHGLGQNTDATPNGAIVCQTSSTADGDVTVDYRVNPGSAQPSGTYTVQTTFTATAR